MAARPPSSARTSATISARARSRYRADDKTPRAGRHHQPRPALRRDGGRCAGAVSGLADEDRAGAGGGVLSGAVALGMSGTNFSLFLAAALIIAAVPGPAIFYVAARTLSGGRKAGIASTFGTALGGLVHVVGGG